MEGNSLTKRSAKLSKIWRPETKFILKFTWRLKPSCDNLLYSLCWYRSTAERLKVSNMSSFLNWMRVVKSI